MANDLLENIGGVQISIKRTMKNLWAIIITLISIKMKKINLLMFGSLVVAVCFFTTNAMAQQTPVNTYSIKGWWGPPSPPFSPVVNADRSITFRVKAPKAVSVNLLFGEWDVKPQPLTKDSMGVWSVTINSVQPDIYSYVFNIDGVQVPDMNNPVTKIGTQIYSSIVEVPGTPARFDEVQNVPHGVLQSCRFWSSVLNRVRAFNVYFPSQYFTEPKRRFPVLYLRHGGGDNETSWSQPAGRADVILENLIARQKAVPMIIVMPNGLTDGSWAGGSTPEGMKALEQELLSDVMPWVEKNCRVLPGRENCAITGLSMGGGQAFVMGLRNLDKFAWVGEFSAGLLSDKDFKVDELLPGIVNASNLNDKLKLFWIGCGKDDPRYNGHLALIDLLNKRGVRNEFHDTPGGHEWKVWRVELAGFMQKVFQ
ncbi:MAG: alpha/beta hydrolase-fold protein [Bacteroidota bacterium]|nr:alpha/beta hydrolase-fold protein [Bacteroidota bacterium]